MQIKQNEGSRECDALWLNSSVRLGRCGCRNSANDSMELLPPLHAECFRHSAGWQGVSTDFIAKHLFSPDVSPAPCYPPLSHQPITVVAENHVQGGWFDPWTGRHIILSPIHIDVQGSPVMQEGVWTLNFIAHLAAADGWVYPFSLSRKQRTAWQIAKDNFIYPWPSSYFLLLSAFLLPNALQNTDCVKEGCPSVLFICNSGCPFSCPFHLPSSPSTFSESNLHSLKWEISAGKKQ